MTLLLALHAAAALVAPPAARRFGHRAALAAAAAPLAATFAWLLGKIDGVLDGGVRTERVSWVPEADLDVVLRLDGLSLLMALLVSGVGVVVVVYSVSYFGDDPVVGRFAGLLTLFAGAMTGLVLADNLLVLYVFWEITSIASWLLIGLVDSDSEARQAARQALLTTVAGGLALLAGLVVLGQASGSWLLSELVESPPPVTATTTAGVLLVVVGILTKSAQFPFQSWLPAAMKAPTPVSAYLHSATMVKAGVYLAARLAPGFAVLYGVWRPVVVVAGAVTMVVAGWRALREYDLKLLLAHSTVSQLGFMLVLVGFGIPEATFAGLAVLLAHALFKGALFLVVGIVDHERHTRDLRELSGLARAMPWTFAVAAVSAASMVGLPPLLGFLAKESAFDALLASGRGAALAAVVAGSVLTFAYSARFLWGGFAGRPSGDGVGHRPSPDFVAPAAVLAAGTVVLGLVPGAASALVEGAAGALTGEAAHEALKLWHGFTGALGLSVLTVTAGVVLFVLRSRVERLQERVALPVTGQQVFERTVRGTEVTADLVTGRTQVGSLPVYLAVVLAFAALLPATGVIRAGGWPSGGLTVTWLEAGVVSVATALAIALAVVRRRIGAVVVLGGIGYSVAVLFLLQGAVDLALTQVLVETLTVAVFVLVLRHLPERFGSVPWRLREVIRVGVAGAVGVFVAGFAFVTANARTGHSEVAEAYLERSKPEGHGANVVNVILTDFRSLDTLGEVTVLVVALLGVASLVISGRRAAR